MESLVFMELNCVYQGDSRELLKKLPNDCVDLSVWSPPYFVGKEYEKYLTYEGWQELIREIISLHYRILKPGGFCVINIADILCFEDESIPRFQSVNTKKLKVHLTAADIIKVKELHPEWKRDQLAMHFGCSEQTIDRRLNGNNIRGGKYKPQTRVNLVGHMIESAGYDCGLPMYDRRVWKKDAAWQNSQWHSSSYRSVDEFEYLYFLWKPGVTKVDRERLTKEEWVNWGGRGVWEFPSVRSNNDHEAKFPEELPRRLIKLLTDKDGIVLDCFLGSGTTAIAAMKLGRQFIGMELEQKYVDLANRNIEKTKQSLKQMVISGIEN